MLNPDEVQFTTKTGMARTLGVARSTIDEWTSKAGFPGGRNGPWFLALVVPWLLKQRQPKTVLDADPLLDGADSPWLERYRKERALTVRMERLQKKGQLLSRERVHSALVRIAGIIRGAGEVLQRQFGAEAHTVLEDALNDAEREIESLANDSSGEGEQESASQ